MAGHCVFENEVRVGDPMGFIDLYRTSFLSAVLMCTLESLFELVMFLMITDIIA